jgi:hypothetical protein
MNLDQSRDQIPFSSGGSVIDKNNLGQAGQYAGSWHNAGRHEVLRLVHPGRITICPLALLEAIGVGIRGSMEDGLREGVFWQTEGFVEACLLSELESGTFSTFKLER